MLYQVAKQNGVKHECNKGSEVTEENKMEAIILYYIKAHILDKQIC